MMEDNSINQTPANVNLRKTIKTTKKKGTFMAPGLSKKMKRKERRKIFLQRLLLPGEPEKFANSNSFSSSLSDAIVDVAKESNGSSKRKPSKKKQNKQWRKKIAPSAIAQFSRVLEHPAFQNNPFDAIKQ